MSTFNYEYFCGANVVVEIESQPLMEAAGISYTIQESKTPLYGYSSRHYDSMARGQVIVQGSILINYIHHDYLYYAIQEGRKFKQARPDASSLPADRPLIGDVLTNDIASRAFVGEISQDPELNKDIIAAYENAYWGQNSAIDDAANTVFDNISTSESTFNPHDYGSSVDLRITFGERSAFNNYAGKTGLLISGVHLIGRGSGIQIDESVIVEEYSFIGRNIHRIQSQKISYGADANSDGSLNFSLNDRDKPLEIVYPSNNPSLLVDPDRQSNRIDELLKNI